MTDWLKELDKITSILKKSEVRICPADRTDRTYIDNKKIKPFYMKVNKDGKTVRAMDVLVPKTGEIIGGSQREDDHDTLLDRIKEMDLNPDDYWWYLELRKFGSAPHAGFGLGFERLVQFVTGMSNIRDVIPFPRTPGNVSF